MADQTVPDRTLFDDRSYFLSVDNPVATRDTCDIEQEALSMLDMPQIVDGRERAAARWKILAGDLTSEQLDGFEQAMDEWAFHYTTLACAHDSSRPRLLGSQFGPPHEWWGHRIPGTRGPGAGENVDNHYTLARIDPYSRFELHGKISQSAPIGDVPIFLTQNNATTINVCGLNWSDVEVTDDGHFVITLDPEPAHGRTNHLQTSLDTHWLFLRDGRSNWSQVPNAYRLLRMDPPINDPLARRQTAELARRMMMDDTQSLHFSCHMTRCLEPNAYIGPVISDAVGGMPTQRLGRAHLDLDDDEAWVVTVEASDSRYWVIILYDWWLMSLDFWSRQTSLNNTQAAPNPDGTCTFVFSAKDPNVHNWLDTTGLRQTLMFHRFQMLPMREGVPAGDLWARAETVKLDDLESALPEGTPRITPDDRRQQLAERAALFQRRYTV